MDGSAGLGPPKLVVYGPLDLLRRGRGEPDKGISHLPGERVGNSACNALSDLIQMRAQGQHGKVAGVQSGQCPTPAFTPMAMMVWASRSRRSSSQGSSPAWTAWATLYGDTQMTRKVASSNSSK